MSVSLSKKMGKKAVKKKEYDEFDSDSDVDQVDDESEEDSDFEDPDLIEVPGGGKNLQTLKNLRGPPGTSAGVSAAKIEANKKSAMPFGSSLLAKNKPSGAAASSTQVMDDELEIVKVVPGHQQSASTGRLTSAAMASQSYPSADALAKASYMLASDPTAMAMAAAASDLSAAASSGLSMNALLNAARASPSGQLDILQKSMQNGGLSRLMSTATSNPFAMWSGGAITSALPGMSALMPGFGARPDADLSASINAKQLSSLWSTERERYRDTLQLMNSSGQSLLRAASGNEEEDAAADDEEDMGVIETYANYCPLKLKIGKSHPDPVVETASMASVEPPDVWYELSLPSDVIDKGKLSSVQLEAVVYASQQHEQFLPNGDRAGFLVGDGAGVGKGRTIAGIIFENYLKGRKKAIWVSVSNDLKYDCERDLRDIGAFQIDVHFLSKMKYGKINSSLNGNVSKGVMYSTYSALIGESQNGGKYKTRLKQLLNWCGEDFDGCIVFDECHRAKNLFPGGSGSGQGGKPTKTGQTVLELQQKLPKARIVYASATGASEPKHMAYMVRLGIWGPGSPFTNFQEFLASVEKRGIGAMEIVAMDMKLRGIYIARQLSFQGVSFSIDEVELSEKMRHTYDQSVKFWVDLMYKFEEAAELIAADKKMKKTIWGQFWSSHQRFFKYLCISSKVHHVVKISRDVIKMGKCVVIGLQSTGEARTMEALEREEELTDFVSTAKGVLQSLIEKHFPAPNRNRINQILAKQGLIKPTTILDELGITVPSNGNSSKGGDSKKRKAKQIAAAASAVARKKKLKLGSDDSDESSNNEDEGSDFELSNEDSEESDDEDDEVDSDDLRSNSEEEDFNPFRSGSESDEDPWARKRNNEKKKKKLKAKKTTGDKVQSKTGGIQAGLNKDARLASRPTMSTVSSGPASSASSLVQGSSERAYVPHSNKAAEDRAIQMKEEMLNKLEKLAALLPANTLDQLIDELGGPENVAEMTGRKGRIVQDENGDIRYESRSEQDVPLETLNLTEKDRFMRGDKDVAIISEAASSGISLQADRRVKNTKRRVHITLELPWSADRAIQQFGRTHRSNQVSAPEYTLLISDLAGEQRFASIVAKRLESLGALTHGDRRATGERDLSRFNIDNKYGRAALEATFKSIMGYERPVIPPPEDYSGDFFKDIADGLVGVGLITQSEDMPGVLALDKGYNDMSKFLNRILGLPVKSQNLLFKYFSDTLAAIVNAAKRSGRYDQGILDVGLSDEDEVELIRTHKFIRKHATGSAKIELHVLHVERGMSWEKAHDKWSELVGTDEGFYLSQQVRSGKRSAILAVQLEKNKRDNEKKKSNKMFIVYRPNTGQQVKHDSLAELKKKYTKVTADEAEPYWNDQFQASAKTCSHAYWCGNCRNVTVGVGCEIGLRRKTYNVLTGSVLSVWTQLETVLTHDGNKKGTTSRMQVVRLRLDHNRRIVGTLIPNSAVQATLQVLSQGSENSEETIH